MNDIQEKLEELRTKGWTLAAIADELGAHYNTVQKWHGGDRYPPLAKAIMLALEQLAAKKRIPKQKRYGSI